MAETAQTADKGLGNGVDFDSLIQQETRQKVRFLLECKRTGILYQNQFRGTWSEIEGQIRCVQPDNWNAKEDWQSKVYVGMQSKKSEVGLSQLNKILFGGGRFFETITDDGSSDIDAEYLTNLIEILLNRSGFDVQNKFTMQEGIDMGTSFIKILMKPNGEGINVTWRSTYQCLVDPMCGHNFDKGRFWIDVFEKDIAYLIEEARNPDSMYDKEVITAFIEDAKQQGDNIMNQRANNVPNTTDSARQLMSIKSIDGTQYIAIPAGFATVDISEYWVKVPQEDGTYKDCKCTLLNNKWMLCDYENTYGFKPVQPCRVKPRKYDFYGRGYLENGRGMQDLMNTCVNLGFDSLKINSMDIVVIDETKVKDPKSIQYKPLAVWKMKDINGVKIQRNPVSAIMDVLRGAQMIDQMDQETSGILKSVEGAPALGSGSDNTTLGEYQDKAQSVDERFLDQARFIENDYLVPFINKIYQIILNPDLFTQDMVNNFLGQKEVDDLGNAVQHDGTVKVDGKKMIPKLDLKKVREESKKGKYHFRCIGATRFAQIAQKIQKYENVMSLVLKSPELMQITNVKVLFKKTLMAAEMEDVDEIIKSDAEIKAAQTPPAGPPAGAQPGGMPPGAGMPPGGMPPGAMPPPGAGGPR